MKIVIEIPEDMYNDANILIVKDLPELKKIIANGIPYEGRPQGQWIKGYSDLDYEEYKCSVCGRVIVIYANLEMHQVLKEYPYCHCGADMRGGRE